MSATLYGRLTINKAHLFINHQEHVILPHKRVVKIFATKSGSTQDKNELDVDPLDSELPSSDEKTARRTRKPKAAKVSKRGRQPDLVETMTEEQRRQLNPDFLKHLDSRQGISQTPGTQFAAEDETNPRRFHWHRQLMAAAVIGDTYNAMQALMALHEAGLPPGPSAYHGLIYAYVRAMDLDGALEMVQNAIASGIPLLPSTYTVLALAMLRLEPPDLESALVLLEAIRVRNPDGALECWYAIIKELFAMGWAKQAMALVQHGQKQGMVPNGVVGALVIQQLCDAGLKEEAMEQLMILTANAVDVGPAHYNPILRLEALQEGGTMALESLEGAAGSPLLWPPEIDSYNAVLSGIAERARPVPNGEAMFEHAVTTVYNFMKKRGMAATSATYRAIAEGFIRLRSADRALRYLQMCRTANIIEGCRQLDSRHISSLLLMLAEDDRPYDVLMVLQAMMSDLYVLPAEALQPISAAGGCTLATSWLSRHHNFMAACAAGQIRQLDLLDEISRCKEVDDNIIAGLGGCVVGPDYVAIAPCNMTSRELKAEVAQRGLVTDDMSRDELYDAVVTLRREMPVEYVMLHLRAAQHHQRAQKVAAEAKKSKSKRHRIGYIMYDATSKEPLKDSVMIEDVGGDYFDEDAEDSGAFLRPDMLGDILHGGVEEGVANIIGMDDSYLGIMPSDDDDFDGDNLDDETPTVKEDVELESVVQVDPYAVEWYNSAAGMDVAIEIMKAVEMLKGRLNGPDWQALVNGCIIERHVNAAVELSRRLHSLSSLPGYGPSAAGEAYGRLADMCLASRSAEAADLVVEQAELYGIQVPSTTYASLNAALEQSNKRRDMLTDDLRTLIGQDIADVLDIDPAGDELALSKAESAAPTFVPVWQDPPVKLSQAEIEADRLFELRRRLIESSFAVDNTVEEHDVDDVQSFFQAAEEAILEPEPKPEDLLRLLPPRPVEAAKNLEAAEDQMDEAEDLEAEVAEGVEADEDVELATTSGGGAEEEEDEEKLEEADLEIMKIMAERGAPGLVEYLSGIEDLGPLKDGVIRAQQEMQSHVLPPGATQKDLKTHIALLEKEARIKAAQLVPEGMVVDAEEEE